MVGIHFKKKTMNIVHLETYTSHKEYLETHKLRVPLDSFICYCIHKFCTSNFVSIKFIPIRTAPENEKVAVTLVEEEGEKFEFLINEYEIPWTVALCVYPVIMADDVIITGLCAVSRQICLYKNCYALREEHDDGLLGFRHTCLQAPNEVSVWTKFCEIEIIRTVQELLKTNDNKEIPNALVRFEDHMRLPVRIHNVYKVAQNLKKESLKAEQEAAKVEQWAKAEQEAANVEQAKAEQEVINVEQAKAEQEVANVEQAKAEQEVVNVEQAKAEQESANIEQAKAEQEAANVEQAKAKQEAATVEQQANAQKKTIVEQTANAQKQINIEQQVNAQKEINVEQQENVDQQTNVEQQANAQTQTDLEQQANAEHSVQKAKSKHKNKIEQQAIADKQDLKENGEGSSGINRTPKTRKWKSQKKKGITIDCSTKMEDLEVCHEFAEGPYLTLADLVLLPSYHIIIQSIGETRFESLLPFTYKWYKNLISITKIQDIFMSLMSQFHLKQLPFDNMTMPVTDDVSLYKCDPKRHNPKKRIYTNNEDIEKALSSLTEGLELTVSDNEFVPSFKWKDIPEHANPYSGYLPDTRVQRKSEQLENLALAVLSMATEGDVIVDFCCGTGHLGILLAYLLPRCTIILLENKVESLFRAKERVKKMRLKNVYYYQCNLDFFIGEFEIGIGLHACGIATDLILDKCIKQNARFVLSPCCYGSIHGTCRLNYPRSAKFSCVSFDDYLYIAHGADQTHKEHPLAVRGARCMTVIDSDRAHFAEEFGYKVKLMRLKPVTCTPKNNLLIGISTEK